MLFGERCRRSRSLRVRRRAYGESRRHNYRELSPRRIAATYDHTRPTSTPPLRELCDRAVARAFLSVRRKRTGVLEAACLRDPGCVCCGVAARAVVVLLLIRQEGVRAAEDEHRDAEHARRRQSDDEQERERAQQPAPPLTAACAAAKAARAPEAVVAGPFVGPRAPRE